MCTSAVECVRASEPAMVRRICERPLRGAPPIIRCPKLAKSMATGRRDCIAGRSSTPKAAGASLPGAGVNSGAGISSSSNCSSSAGSQGLCCGGMPSERLASRMVSTSTFRSVISSSSRDSAFGLVRAARPRSSQASGPTQGMRTAGSAAPGRRPPTRPDWNGTSEACPRRTYARPGVFFEMCPASGESMTSDDSPPSVTRSAIRRLVLARISGDTTPEGRWVARRRWIPRERPR